MIVLQQASFLMGAQALCKHCGKAYIPLNLMVIVQENLKTTYTHTEAYFCSKEHKDAYENNEVSEYRENREKWG